MKKKSAKKEPQKRGMNPLWVFGIVILAAFALLGVGYAVFIGNNAGPSVSSNPGNAPGVPAAPSAGNVQVVSVRALSTGAYDKDQVSVKAGVPVRFDFSADPNSGCGRQLVIRPYNIELISRNGETQSATFTPQAPGIIPYHCGMNMFRGQLIVQ